VGEFFNGVVPEDSSTFVLSGLFFNPTAFSTTTARLALHLP